MLLLCVNFINIRLCQRLFELVHRLLSLRGSSTLDSFLRGSRWSRHLLSLAAILRLGSGGTISRLPELTFVTLFELLVIELFFFLSFRTFSSRIGPLSGQRIFLLHLKHSLGPVGRSLCRTIWLCAADGTHLSALLICAHPANRWLSIVGVERFQHLLLAFHGQTVTT